jgi:hypothetical protein
VIYCVFVVASICIVMSISAPSSPPQCSIMQTGKLHINIPLLVLVQHCLCMLPVFILCQCSHIPKTFPQCISSSREETKPETASLCFLNLLSYWKLNYFFFLFKLAFINSARGGGGLEIIWRARQAETHKYLIIQKCMRIPTSLQPLEDPRCSQSNQ